VPGARTVIALGIPYSAGKETAGQPERPVIARYARGRDYHLAHRDRMRALRHSLLEMDPTLNSYACVDAGVAMEKAWAERAGLGWIGKHGLVVSREHGSWFTLSVMVIDRSLDRYHEPHPRLCGDCDLCLRACPTGAFPAPGVVDARLCLSFSDGGKPRVDPGRAFGRRWPDVHSAVMPARKSAPTITLGCLRAIPGKPRDPSGSCQRRRLQRWAATTLLVWQPVPPWPVRATMACAATPPWRWARMDAPARAPRSCNSAATPAPWSARPRNGRLGTAADRVPARALPRLPLRLRGWG